MSPPPDQVPARASSQRLRPLRVLVVEDSESDAALILRELRRSHFDPDWRRVASAAELQQALACASWEVVLGNYSLPQFTGLEALRIVQACAPDLPFILVSDSIGEDVVVEAMKAGAQDYLTMNHLARLGAAVTRELREADERRARRQAEAARDAAVAETRRLLEAAEEARGALLSAVEEARRTAAYLQRRLACESAAAECMRLMVEGGDWGELMPKLLTILREAEGASRAYAFRNEHAPAGLCAVPIFEVVADGISPQIANPRLHQGPYETEAPSLLAALLARRPFARVRDELIGPERDLLDELGVLSLLILPIFKGPTFWGFIGFEDSWSARRWEEPEIRLLQLVADGIGVTLLHEDMEAELRLRSTALEAVANTIVITDLNGKITWANPAFTHCSGYSLEDALGRTPGELLKSGKHEPAFYRDMWETILAGRVWQGDVINRRKDGGLYHEEMTITPLEDAVGRITHFIAVKQDTTHRKDLEDQLRQSQKMEAIGQLAGGVAHDFNNMLAVILMNASFLRMEDGMTLREAEPIQQIVLAAERAANLTRQLLLFSRRQVMQARPVQLSEVIGDMTKMLQRIIGEDIALQTRTAPGTLVVHGDPGMLEQVLLNFAVNARDAMPKGGEIAIELDRITLTPATALHPRSKPGRYARISFRDTGSGIPPENLSRIFEPFFTTKDVGKGTGLGLATVHGIVEQHQGWMEVESQLGRGTTFRVYLPCLADNTIHLTRQHATPIRGGHETILLVEDELILRTLITRTLEKHGYQVLSAAAGPAALGLWNQHRDQVSLLLTDVVIPEGMSGGELAQRLRAENPKLRVLFMTGYPGEVAGRGLDLREGENLLQKPFPPSKLAQAVRNSLDSLPAGGD